MLYYLLRQNDKAFVAVVGTVVLATKELTASGMTFVCFALNASRINSILNLPFLTHLLSNEYSKFFRLIGAAPIVAKAGGGAAKDKTPKEKAPKVKSF